MFALGLDSRRINLSHRLLGSEITELIEKYQTFIIMQAIVIAVFCACEGGLLSGEWTVPMEAV